MSSTMMIRTEAPGRPAWMLRIHAALSSCDARIHHPVPQCLPVRLGGERLPAGVAEQSEIDYGPDREGENVGGDDRGGRRQRPVRGILHPRSSEHSRAGHRTCQRDQAPHDGGDLPRTTGSPPMLAGSAIVSTAGGSCDQDRRPSR